jgi:hypothetical protein
MSLWTALCAVLNVPAKNPVLWQRYVNMSIMKSPASKERKRQRQQENANKLFDKAKYKREQKLSFFVSYISMAKVFEIYLVGR